MPVRNSMGSLIYRERTLINDLLPAGQGQVFTDQQIQDVMDQTRQNIRYLALAPSPTYLGSTISYLDYYSDWTDWEDDLTLWQYRIISVSPAVSENITGHWTFAATTLPPVFIIGKTYDVYRTAADLLEQRAAMWMMSHSLTVDGQNLARGQVLPMILQLAKTYRMKQRAITIGTIRSDMPAPDADPALALAPTEIDYMGDGSGH
jgi:hypothetical protein